MLQSQGPGFILYVAPCAYLRSLLHVIEDRLLQSQGAEDSGLNLHWMESSSSESPKQEQLRVVPGGSEIVYDSALRYRWGGDRCGEAVGIKPYG